MYRILVIDTFLGVGLQKVYCQFRYLLSSFFLLDRFLPNFGNLLNLISYRSPGYFRSYLFKFFFCIFSVIPVCRFSSLRATACLVCIYPWGFTLYTTGNSFKSLNFYFLSLIGVSDSEVFIVLILIYFSLLIHVKTSATWGGGRSPPHLANLTDLAKPTAPKSHSILS
jgi:hypothetical protein